MSRQDGTTHAPLARRSAAIAMATLSLATLGMLAWPDRAAASHCPAGTAEFGLLCIRNATPSTTAPAPTTTTTAPAAPPPVAPPPAAVPPAAPAVSVADGARRLMELANAERAKAGLGALSWRDDVASIALVHSERMAAAGDIFHSDSFFGSSVRNLLNAVARGENVAYNGSVDSAHSRLMASSGHRANILDARFSVVGIGVVRHADGRYFITQNFIQPAGAPRSVAPRQATTAAPKASPKPPGAPRPAAPAATTTTEAPAPTPTTAVALAPVVPPDAAILSLANAAPRMVTAVPASSSSEVGLAAVVAAVLLVTALMALACWMIPRRFRQ